MSVAHVQANPLPSFNDIFASLKRYGFAAEGCEYLVWRRRLEQHVMEVQDNALFPLLHFVLDDLPTSTKAPGLDDANMRAILRQDSAVESMTVSAEVMGKYLSWLVQAQFLPSPTGSGEQLPNLGKGATVKAVGRSGA